MKLRQQIFVSFSFSLLQYWQYCQEWNPVGKQLI